MYMGGSPQGNARGEMVFYETITGTGIANASQNPTTFNDRCLFAWNPTDGLILLGADRDHVAHIFNGGPGTAIGFDLIAGATGEGTGLSLNDSGWITFRARDAFGNYSIYRTQLGQPGASAADFNHDGDLGTDSDIDAFFACLGGNCCPACDNAADFNGDGDLGTDADIEAFFRVLGGGAC